MPDEEPGRVVPRELRDAGVPAHVGVQRLLLGAEGVEQVQCQLPVVSFVVPLPVWAILRRLRDTPGAPRTGFPTPPRFTGAGAIGWPSSRVGDDCSPTTGIVQRRRPTGDNLQCLNVPNPSAAVAFWRESTRTE